MSSVRNEQMTISQGDLDILDDFMKQLGAVYYPGYNNTDEPADMPWSTRWVIHEALTLTDGGRCGWHVTPEVAQFMRQNMIIKSGE